MKDKDDSDAERFEMDIEGSKTSISLRNSGKKRVSSPAPWYYLGLIGEIGFAIALPIAGGALVGVVVDRTWSTTPKAALSLLFVGIIVSFLNLYKTVMTIIKNKS